MVICIKSSLFKVIEDDATQSSMRITSIFTTLKNQITGIFSSTNTISFSAQYEQGLLSANTALYNYMNLLNAGVPAEQAFAMSMREQDAATQEFALGLNTVSRSAAEMQAVLDNYTRRSDMMVVSTQAQNKSLSNCRSIINSFNDSSKRGSLSQTQFAQAVGQSNPILGRYLANLNGSRASMGGYVTALIAGKVATIGLRIATMALNAALSMGISFLISEGISLLMNFVESEKNAAEAARETADASREKTEQLNEEAQSLKDLISKYKELKQNGDNSSENREEIQSVQNDIVKLVGDEADILDLVNGKLDTEYAKLLKIRAEKAKQNQSDYQKATNDAVNEYENTDFTNGDWLYDKFDAYENDITINVADRKGLDIIDKALDAKGLGNAYYNKTPYDPVSIVSELIGTGDIVGAAHEISIIRTNGLSAKDRLDSISAAIDALNEAAKKGEYSTDDSELWNKLVELKQTLTSSEGTLTKAKNAATNQISNIIEMNIEGVSDVKSADDLEKYRDKIKKAIYDDDKVSKALQDELIDYDFIDQAVNSYISKIDGLQDYYNQWYEKYGSDIAKGIQHIQLNFGKTQSYKGNPNDPKNSEKNQKKIKEFNDWINGLSKKDKELVYKISCDNKEIETSKWSLEEWQSALALSRKEAEKTNPTLAESAEKFKRIKDEMKGLGLSGANGKNAKFGNINLDKRGTLEWNDKNIKKYEKELKSWYNPKTDGTYDEYLTNTRGEIATVLGAWDNFGTDKKPLNIAFSPMLQTRNGSGYKLQLLSKETVNKYINQLITDVSKSKKNWTSEDLLKLDAEGLEIEGQKIKGLIADIGETAEKTAQSMHYMGTDGAYREAYNQYYTAMANAYKTNFRESFESDSFKNTKKKLEEFAKTANGITGDNIEQLAADSADLANMLAQDGMNANWLANIIQSELSGGEGFDLITDDALKLSTAIEGMAGQWDELSAARSRYEQATKVEEKDADFKSMAEAFKALNGEFEKGTTNSNQFWAAAEYIFGKDKLEEWGWSDGLDKIYAAMQKNVGIFKDADSAGSGFLERLNAIATNGEVKGKDGNVIAQIEKLADGSWDFNVDALHLDELAQKMGLSKEAVLSCLKALSMWGDVDYYNIEEVLDAVKQIGLTSDSFKGTAVNVSTLTDQLISMGYTSKEIHDVLGAMQKMDGITLLNAQANVDGLTTSLTNLGIAKKDGKDITINVDGLNKVASEMNMSKDDAKKMINTLGKANGIKLTDAKGEAVSLKDALKKVNKVKFATVKDNLEETKDKANDAKTAVDNLKTSITTLKGKTITITVDAKAAKSKKKLFDSLGISGISYYEKGTQNAKGGKAIVGEKGEELWIHNGTATVVGSNGAELVKVGKGDIVLPADETRRVMRGSSIIHGHMPAYSAGYPGQAKGKIKTNKGYQSVLPSDDKDKGKDKSSSDKTKSQSENKEDKKLKSFQNWTKKLFDWIEVRLSRVKRKIDNAVKSAETNAENGKFSKSAAQYRKAIKETQKLIDNNTSGAKRYKQQANAVLKKATTGDTKIIDRKKANKLVKKIKNGTIDISQYGEKTQEFIKEYQSFYEKSLDCKDALADLNKNMSEYYEKLYNLPIDEATRKIDKLSASLNVLQKKADAVSGGSNVYAREVVKNRKSDLTAAQKANKKAKNKIESSGDSLLKSLSGKSKKKLKGKIKKGKKVSLKGLKGEALKRAKAYNAAIDNQKITQKEEKDANTAYQKALNLQKKYKGQPSYMYENALLGEETENAKDQYKANQVASRKASKNLTAAEKRKAKADAAVKKAKKKGKNSKAYKQAIKEQKAANKALKAARAANKTATQNAAIAEAEYTKTLQENTKAMGDNILKYHESIRAINSARKALYEAQNTLNETRGKRAKQSDYDSLISNAKQDIKDANKAYKDYLDWYNKNKNNLSDEDRRAAKAELLNLEAAAVNAQTSYEELINARGQIPFSDLEHGIELLDALKNRYAAFVSYMNAIGRDEGSYYYLQQITTSQQQAAKALDEYHLALKKAAKARQSADGVYEGKSAEDWGKEADQYMANYYKYLEEAKEMKTTLAHYLEEPFEKAIKKIEHFEDVLNGLSDLINDDMFFDDDGKLTQYGTSQISLLVEGYEAGKDKLAEYSAELEQVNENYAKGYYSAEEYQERTEELNKSMLDGAKAVKSSLDEIIKMYKDMAQTELDAVKELIDKRQDALDKKKSYYEWDKNLKGKNKEIEQLQAEIAALEGISGAAAKSKRAQLMSDLAEKQEDLDDTLKDHYFELSKDSLDEMKDTLQEAFDKTWKEISLDITKQVEILTAAQNLASSSVNNVNSSLVDLLKFYGVNPSNANAITNTGYASGTRSVPRNMFAWVNERGQELITSNKGTITPLAKGDGVIPADLTDRLIALATGGISSISGKNAIPDMELKNVGNVTQHYDSLIKIEGSADAATVEDLKKFSKDFLQKSYEYTSNQIYKNTRKTGGKRQV